MKTYIALLRGINVSGQKIIKMETLRKVLEELDFTNVSTYIQSGNIIFQSSVSDTSKLEQQISKLIDKHFGFDVSVIVVTPNDLKQIVVQNPYAERQLEDPAQPYVSFLSEVPTAEAMETLKAVDFKGDNFILIEKALYLNYVNGAGDSKLSNKIIESKLKLTSTARNWKTVNKLIAMSDAIK